MCRWSVDEVLASRPPIRINQVGYLPGRPMRATLVTSSPDPLEFVVRDRDRLMWQGMSQPWPVRPEPTSGMTVHVLDFTGAGLSGPVLRLEAGALRSHAFTVGQDLYGRLTTDALRVFRLLRSGVAIPDDVLAGYGRPAGHAGRPPNRGDTDVSAWTGPDAERLYPGWRCAGTFDVSGGWYDAGDYGKYVTSGSIAVWQLLSTLDVLLAAERDRANTLAAAVRRRVPLAARLAAPDAGAERRPARRTWHSIGSMAPSGHRCPAGPTRTQHGACCTDRRRPPACTWRRRRRTAPDISPVWIRPTPASC